MPVSSGLGVKADYQVHVEGFFLKFSLFGATLYYGVECSCVQFLFLLGLTILQVLSLSSSLGQLKAKICVAAQLMNRP